MLKICLLAIEFYQMFLSFDSGVLQPLAPGGACKYFPSCSEYMKQSMVKFGVVTGFWMGLGRIISCR